MTISAMIQKSKTLDDDENNNVCREVREKEHEIGMMMRIRVNVG